MVSVLFFVFNEEREFSIMKLKMDKSSIRAQKQNYLGKEKKATVILAEPQVLRQWDDVAKSIQIPSQGINILHV